MFHIKRFQFRLKRMDYSQKYFQNKPKTVRMNKIFLTLDLVLNFVFYWLYGTVFEQSKIGCFVGTLTVTIWYFLVEFLYFSFDSSVSSSKNDMDLSIRDFLSSSYHHRSGWAHIAWGFYYSIFNSTWNLVQHNFQLIYLFLEALELFECSSTKWGTLFSCIYQIDMVSDDICQWEHFWVLTTSTNSSSNY